MHIGEVLREIRKAKNMTQIQLHELTGLSQGYIADIENGKIKDPTIETLVKIGKVFNMSEGDVIHLKVGCLTNSGPITNELQRRLYVNNIISRKTKHVDDGDTILNTNEDIRIVNNQNLIKLPIVGIIRAGQPILVVENIEGYFPIDKTFLSQGKEYFYLRVQGDSMNMEFPENSLVLVEKTPCLENGQIGVIMINGFEATVKKVAINNNIITLVPMSSNPEHQLQIFDLTTDEISIIGRVVMAIKKY